MSQLSAASNNSVESMSFKAGTLSKRCTPSANKVEKRTGNAAFLEPLAAIEPESRLPPTTTIESTMSLRLESLP
jgi:hypothetical protein